MMIMTSRTGVGGLAPVVLGARADPPNGMQSISTRSELPVRWNNAWLCFKLSRK